MSKLMTWKEVKKKYGQDIADSVDDEIYDKHGASASEKFGTDGWFRDEVEKLCKLMKDFS